MWTVHSVTCFDELYYLIISFWMNVLFIYIWYVCLNYSVKGIYTTIETMHGATRVTVVMLLLPTRRRVTQCYKM